LWFNSFNGAAAPQGSREGLLVAENSSFAIGAARPRPDLSERGKQQETEFQFAGVRCTKEFP